MAAAVDYYTELINTIKRGVFQPVYLFYGEEGYLREQAAGRFIEFCRQDGGLDFNIDLIDGDTAGPGDIVASAETLPLLATKRLVIVKNPSFFKGAKRAAREETAEIEGKPASRGETVLLKYLKEPLDSTILLFNTDEPVDKRKRLFKAVQKAGRAVEFTCLKRNDLMRLMAQKAGKAGCRLAGGALDKLLDLAGPSLQKLSVEFDKLLSYAGPGGLISVGDVCRLCPPVLEDNIFAIVDAVGNRRCGEALGGIKDMLAAKEPPLRILAMITRQFRLLVQVHDLTGKGRPPREIAARLKMHPYVAQKLAAQCKNFSGESLIRIFQSLLDIDEAVKTGRQEFYPAVEHFILKLCAQNLSRGQPS